MSNHTTAPWRIYNAPTIDTARFVPFQISGADGFPVCKIMRSKTEELPGVEREAEANAYLIAAAPDMLDELERSLLQMCSLCGECKRGRNGLPLPGEEACFAFRKRKSIIAKAKGES